MTKLVKCVEYTMVVILVKFHHFLLSSFALYLSLPLSLSVFRWYYLYCCDCDCITLSLNQPPVLGSSRCVNPCPIFNSQEPDFCRSTP